MLVLLQPLRSRGKSAYPVAAPYDELRHGVDRLIQNVSFRYVALSGGEPLLYAPLLKLIGWLSERKQSTILTTNDDCCRPSD